MPLEALATVLLGVFVAAALAAGCSKEASEKAAQRLVEPKPRSTQRPPSIVLLSIDTLRADHLGAWGYPRPVSPTLDRMAARSVRFARAISQAPSTAPAHMSIFTGLAPPVHGVHNAVDGEITELPEHIETYVERLRKSGYLTVGLHGGVNVDAAFGFDRGFDLYSQDLISYNWIRASWTGADLEPIRSWLQMSRASDKPLFLFLHHYVCHAPYVTAPAATAHRFTEGRLVEGLFAGMAPSAKRELVELLGKVREPRARMMGILDIYRRQSDVFWSGVELARPEHRKHVEGFYDAQVSYADQLLKWVLAIFRDEKELENTIFVVLSDHAEEFGEHGGKEHERLFVEHLHVPLLIKFPRSEAYAGRVVWETVRTMDVFPTLFDYLGLQKGEPVQGQTLMPLLTKRGSYDVTVASFGQRGRSFPFVRMEREGFSYSTQPTKDGAEWLFDLGDDSKEQEDLKARRPIVLERFRARAAEIYKEHAAFARKLENLGRPEAGADSILQKQLQALGYTK